MRARWSCAIRKALSRRSRSGEIPYGHKIAVRDIKLGELIFKYGEEIGIATQNIKKGDHVHIQNLDSLRGRGDLPKREGNYHGV